jgi:hypothetical protein
LIEHFYNAHSHSIECSWCLVIMDWVRKVPLSSCRNKHANVAISMKDKTLSSIVLLIL